MAVQLFPACANEASADRKAFRFAKFFTLIELLLVIAVIAILAAMLLPALTSAKKAGIIALCASNLHGVNQTLLTYSNDFNGWGPKDIDLYDGCQIYPASQLDGYFIRGGDTGSAGDKSKMAQILACPGTDPAWTASNRRSPGRVYNYSTNPTNTYLNMSYMFVFGSPTHMFSSSNYRWGWYKYLSDMHPIPNINYLGRRVDDFKVQPPSRQPMSGDPVAYNSTTKLLDRISLNSAHTGFKPSHDADQNTVFFDGHVAHRKFKQQLGQGTLQIVLAYQRLVWPK